MRSLLDTVILVVDFPFHHFKYILLFPLAFRVSVEPSAVCLMGIPLYVICCFYLAVFNSYYLYLMFVSLINICLGMFLLRFILYETLLAFLNWVANSFPILGKFLTIISSNIFSYPLILSSSSQTPMIQMLCLMLSQRSLRLFSFLLILFFLLRFIYFHHSIFQLTCLLFCLSYSASGSL